MQRDHVDACHKKWSHGQLGRQDSKSYDRDFRNSSGDPQQMQPLARLFLMGLLVIAPQLAAAHGCPLEMFKIDQALAAKPKLDAASLKKVHALRKEAEELHKQEKHGEAMLVLGSAKKILKID
jgi:hypothetical protein